MKSTLEKTASLLLSAALALAGGTALAEDHATGSLPLLDRTRWQYNAEHDFYWQTGLGTAPILPIPNGKPWASSFPGRT